jgi:hypothetical protein
LPEAHRQPTPALYAALMLAAGILAVAAAWVVGGTIGGQGRPAQLAAACAGVGAILSLLPGLFVPRRGIGNWGFLVLGWSMLRLLLMLVLGLVLVPAEGSRPFWLALVAGAGTLLVAETAVAAWFITRFEHIRASRPAPEHA